MSILQSADGKTQIIINGGNPLEGCPKSWEESKAWEENANKDKDDLPEWRFDCGYKLDYDGGLINVSSRFYPPTTHYGATWDGCVKIEILGKPIEQKQFDCATLDELKMQVEKYVGEFIEKLLKIFPPQGDQN